MTWFKHRHYWRPMTDINRVIDPATKLATSCLIVEDCLCGAVRTVEFSAGTAPTVRVVEPADKA